MFKVYKILKIKGWEHLDLLMCLRKQQVSYLFKNISHDLIQQLNKLPSLY